MTNSTDNWHLVCKEEDIDMEDLIRFDHANSTYCIYKLEDGFYATDGICTHEAVHLEDGLVMVTLASFPYSVLFFVFLDAWYQIDGKEIPNLPNVFIATRTLRN